MPTVFEPQSSLTGTVRAMIETQRAEGAFSAAQCLILQHGEVLVDLTTGVLATYGNDGAQLDEHDRVNATPSTMFDLASLTKTFSAYTLLSMVREGILDLDEPVVRTLAPWAEPGKRKATLRHLLTHTAGLPPSWYGWRTPLLATLRAGGPERLTTSPIASMKNELEEDLLSTPLDSEPGQRRRYSDVSFNTAMVLAERVTGRQWPELVRAYTLEPLGLDQVTFHPDPKLTACTEYAPELHRGMIQGDVHDETSWAMGGECANAGLFATARAVADFAETLRIGACEPASHLLWDDELARIVKRAVPFEENSLNGASLGLQIGATHWMGVHGGESRGHTGFTGTSFQIDRRRALTIVLLTNRVHPSRSRNLVTALRPAVAEAAFAWVDQKDNTTRRGTGNGPWNHR